MEGGIIDDRPERKRGHNKNYSSVPFYFTRKRKQKAKTKFVKDKDDHPDQKNQQSENRLVDLMEKGKNIFNVVDEREYIV